MAGVAVAPDFHRQGIGRHMMQHAIAQSRAAGCYEMPLSTSLEHKKAHAC
ncbi:GNAT family N-acetyltransferase [Rubidibacter lacunae]